MQATGEVLIAAQASTTASEHSEVLIAHTGNQSGAEKISEASVQDEGVESFGDQPYSRSLVREILYSPAG